MPGVTWYRSIQNNQLYLVLEPAASVAVEVFYTINGKETTNKYQESELKAEVLLTATQADMAEAILKEFNVVWADLREINNDFSGSVSL